MSEPATHSRLQMIAIDRLRPHPANANLMDETLLTKLAENISREGNYPPLVVRPHPDETGAYQVLDGHQRLEALRRLAHATARCYLWPCDDKTALVLLATLNRLEGEDVPHIRAELLQQLARLAPPAELARLLPEDETDIQRTIDLLDLDLDRLVADLTAAAGARPGSPVALTFAVPADEVEVIETAVRRAASGLEGANRRGRALAGLARRYLEVTDG
jgi:ParB family chromosome partitioning protein